MESQAVRLAEAHMATLTIKNVPVPLVQRLKSRAALHRRSLNLEVIVSLETVTGASPVDPETLLARVREVRRVPVRLELTDRTLARLKTAGRP